MKLTSLIRSGTRAAIRAGAVLVCLAALGPPAHAQPETWTVNGESMPLDEFIAQVAEITGKTIVVDSRVKGQSVTVISNIELDADGVYELFLTVLRVHRLGAVETDGVVSVVESQALKSSAGQVADPIDKPADMMVAQVVPIAYALSSDVVKVLRPLVPQTGLITSIDKPNVVIVVDLAANMRRILSLIEKIDILDEEEVVHRSLEHAWVGSVAVLLEEIAPEQLGRNAKGPQRVLIVANERDNSLILKGKAQAIAEALVLIDKLDVPETATNAARVIHLNHADAVDVAAILDKLVNQSTAENAPVANIQADETLNALIVRAEPTTMSEILSTVAQLDVRRAQVLIETAVVEISLSTTDTHGVELVAGDVSGKAAPVISTTLNGVVGGILKRAGAKATDAKTVGLDPVAVASGFASPTIALAKLDPKGVFFGAIVSALATDTRANLLSTPSVLTLDNEEATNISGQEIPFRTGSFTTTTDGASNPFQTINRENVGIELKVTPHIHEDLSMRMTVSLSVGNVADSDARGGVGIGNAGFADIVTNNRSLETTILVNDQQIIMLGGLIQDDYTNVGRRVPLLGDIPGLGRAFRSKRKTLVKRHLLMFLRPTVLLSGEAAVQLAGDRYRGIYRLRGKESPVPTQLHKVFEGSPGEDAPRDEPEDASED